MLDASVYDDEQLHKVIRETEDDLRLLLAEHRRRHPRVKKRRGPAMVDVAAEVDRLGVASLDDICDSMPDEKRESVWGALLAAASNGLISRRGENYVSRDGQKTS